MFMALHEQLYGAALRRAEALTGPTSRELARYEENFFASLPKTYQPATLGALIKAMAGQRLVLCGDFHSLPSSQTAFLSLVSMAIRQARGAQRKPLIALECFQASAQTALAAYLDERISEEELLTASAYHRFWGFPWEHYRPILQFARKHGLEVLALNQQYSGADSLAKRDAFMARRLLAAQREHANRPIYCLVGEQHLAAGHLPEQIVSLQKKESQPGRAPLRIISHCDQYFFAVLQQAQATAGDFTPCLQLADDFFCLLSAPPWYKWLTHSLWSDCLLHECQAQGDGLAVNYMALGPEIDDYFVELLRLLAHYFGLPLQEEDLLNFHFKILPPNMVVLPRGGVQAKLKPQHPLQSFSASRSYHLAAGNHTITWPAFAWDGFIAAAGEFLFRLAQGAKDRKGRHAETLPQRLAEQIASQLVLLLLNPALAYSGPTAPSHTKWTHLIASQIEALASPLSYQRGFAHPALSRLPLPAADFCQIVAQQLYQVWQGDEGVMQEQLGSIFALGSQALPQFVARLLASLLQAPKPRSRSTAGGRGSKSGL